MYLYVYILPDLILKNSAFFQTRIYKYIMKNNFDTITESSKHSYYLEYAINFFGKSA